MRGYRQNAIGAGCCTPLRPCYHVGMFTIAIVSQKGGAGKTTLAINLAVASELAGEEAIVLDMDPQGSAQVWARVREARAPLVVAASPEDLPALVEQSRVAGAGLVLVDTGAGVGSPSIAAARAADLVIVPCRPSLFDLEAATASFAIAEEAGTLAAGLVWAVPARSSLGPQAIAALRAAGIRMIGSEIGHRTAYAHAVTAGKGVQEHAPRSAAARETEKLYAFTREMLKKIPTQRS